ncbi:MAG: Flp family type IVb pilin [Chlorobaculum sp.]
MLKSINSQKGITFIEYAMIAALVSITTILILTPIGQMVQTFFDHVVNCFPH